MTAHADRLIGERLARAAVVYQKLRDAELRLDAAKAQLPQSSPLAAIAREMGDHASMYVTDRYLTVLDSINAWINAQAMTMNRVAETIEGANL